MNRRVVGTVLAWIAAFGFLGTAGLHSTGLGSARELAASAQGPFRDVIPALWLAFSVDLCVLGLVVAAAAARPIGPARFVLVFAAASPVGAAILQLRYIGFIPPTAILLTVGLIAVLSAVVLPGAGHARAAGGDRA